MAVLRESLRHFPVAPRLPKVVMQDTIINSKGSGEFEPVAYAVPKGSVVVSLHVCQRIGPGLRLALF